MNKLITATVGTLCLTLAGGSQTLAATIAPPFANHYTIDDLGTVPQLPPAYAGLTFKLNDPNTIIIGGAASTSNAGIYTVPVQRGSDNRITGFGIASFLAQANGIAEGGIDASLTYSPQEDVLFYTSYPDNSIGQIKIGSNKPDKQINLATLGIPESTGAIAFVPSGFPGAGRLKITSYTANTFYDTTISPDGKGTYNIAPPSKSIKLDGGLDALTYIKAGNPGFTKDSLLIAEYDSNNVSAYEIDANGDPIPTTRQTFITGINNVLPTTSSTIGAAVDPLTGDLLYSTYFENQPSPAKILAVRGFLHPTSVPEPSTGLFTSLAVVSLGLMFKRKVACN